MYSENASIILKYKPKVIRGLQNYVIIKTIKTQLSVRMKRWKERNTASLMTKKKNLILLFGVNQGIKGEFRDERLEVEY